MTALSRSIDAREEPNRVAYAWRMSVRLGFQEFFAANPPRILLTATVPRTVLQVLFWVVLGSVAAGADGERYSFIGVAVTGAAAMAIAGMSDPPVTDKWTGCYTRLQRGMVPPWFVYLGRSVAIWVVALLEVLVSWLLVGVITGQFSAMIAMLPAMPVIILITMTMAAAGYFCAAFCTGKRAEVAIYNLATYLVIVCTGALIPRGESVILDVIGGVLPGTHGLTVVRAIADGASWEYWQLLLELGIGLGWLAAGIVLHIRMSRGARQSGSDAFS